MSNDKILPSEQKKIVIIQWVIVVLFLLGGLQGLIGAAWGGTPDLGKMWPIFVLAIIEIVSLIIFLARQSFEHTFLRVTLITTGLLTIVSPWPRNGSDVIWPMVTIPLFIAHFVQYRSIRANPNA